MTASKRLNEWYELLSKTEQAPWARRQEVEWAFEQVEEFGPFETFVEIGVHRGGTLYVMAQMVREGGLVIGVDSYLPYNQFTEKDVKANKQAARHSVDLIRESGRKATLIPESSSDALKTVKSLLGGKTIDLLHIDGGHFYEDAKRDFELYSPLVSKDGIIQIHDICRKPKVKYDKARHVADYWPELAAKYETRQFQDTGPTRDPGAGVGIVIMR